MGIGLTHVVPREIPAGQQRDPHGLEISRIHLVETGVQEGLFRKRHALWGHCSLDPHRAHEPSRGVGRRADAGQRGSAVAQGFVERPGAGRRIAHILRVERERHHMFAVEPRVDAVEVVKGAQHQRRAGQQHHRKSCLQRHGDESGRRPAVPPAGPPFGGKRHAPRGHQAERQHAEPGGRRQEQEHARIRLDGQDLRAAELPVIPRGRQQADQLRRSDPGERRAEGRARNRQQQVFGQQLAHQPPPSGAQRRTDRQFPPPSGRAGQQQPGHVGADHQQQQGHAAEQQPQSARELIAQLRNTAAGEFEPQPRVVALDLLLDLRGRHRIRTVLIFLARLPCTGAEQGREKRRGQVSRRHTGREPQQNPEAAVPPVTRIVNVEPVQTYAGGYRHPSHPERGRDRSCGTRAAECRLP